MIGKRKIWHVKEFNKEKAGCLAAELDVSPIVTGILLERGFTTAEAMREFLYGSKTPFHDPFLMKDMEKTVQRIKTAMQTGEKITVYGDYDVDGITAASLLYIYLKEAGACVDTYIPKRENEGYGLNDAALKFLAEHGTGLVVTVDCGISGVHEVEQAPAGMDIIITDHHTVPEIVPPAYAIINPKQADCNYPFKSLSGVGVAFKLCQALALSDNTKEYWQDLTELAALGTVADIVPLLGENREIVRRGLAAMKNTRLPGLQALIKASGCNPESITSENIGFMLAPRLNAVGRLEHAQSAVELLVSDDLEKATVIADSLNRENALRQEISRQIMEDAEAMLAEQKHIDTAIVLASENWHQGVIGIVASRLVEKYHLPVVLLSICGDIAKGSCRSIPALNLYEAINAESDILLQFGGHHQAAGLTLPAEKIDEFRDRFRKYVALHLQEEDYYPELDVDCVLSENGLITVRDLEELALLEPFGCCNLTPVFAFRNAVMGNQRAIGKDRTHLQFSVSKGDCSYKAVMWNHADLMPLLYDGMLADIAFMPRINIWIGEKSVQLHALSVRQKIEICDLRKNVEDKSKIVEMFLRTADKLTVLVNEIDEQNCLPISEHLQIRTYEDAVEAEQVILYDLPERPLKEIISNLIEAGVKQAVLAFNRTDREKAETLMRLQYPDRAFLAVVYKKIMGLLHEQPEIDAAKLLEEEHELICENSLHILQELGFIVRENNLLRIGTIRKCNLEDSSLYVALQQQRAKLLENCMENMRISQYELLRA